MSSERIKSTQTDRERSDLFPQDFELLKKRVQALRDTRGTDDEGYRRLVARIFLTHPDKVKKDPDIKETIIGIFSNDLEEEAKESDGGRHGHHGPLPRTYLIIREIVLLIESFELEGFTGKTQAQVAKELGFKGRREYSAAINRALERLLNRGNLDRFTLE